MAEESMTETKTMMSESEVVVPESEVVVPVSISRVLAGRDSSGRIAADATEATRWVTSLTTETAGIATDTRKASAGITANSREACAIVADNLFLEVVAVVRTNVVQAIAKSVIARKCVVRCIAIERPERAAAIA